MRGQRETGRYLSAHPTIWRQILCYLIGLNQDVDIHVDDLLFKEMDATENRRLTPRPPIDEEARREANTIK